MSFTIRNCTVTLAGTALTGEEGITGFAPMWSGPLDVVSPSGGVSVEVYSRGNGVMSFSFTSIRRFATDALLEKFVLQHQRTCPKSGALVMTAGGVAHTAATAGIQQISIGDPEGLLLPVTYSITSSELIAAS